MTEFVTIEKDYDTPVLDAMKHRAKECWRKYRKKRYDTKVPFECNSAWKRCFSGREEIGYANI